MRNFKIHVSINVPIFLILIFLAFSCLSLQTVYASDNPDFFDTCEEDGIINKPISDDQGFGVHLAQYPYGTEKIKAYMPVDTYPIIYGFNHYETVEFQPDDCDYDDGWWTIDFSSGSFDCNLDEVSWIIEAIDPELCDGHASYYWIMPEGSEINSLIIKVGGEGSPLPVYLTKPDGIIVTIPEYNEPTELKLKTGNNGVVVESNQDIFYTTDGVDPKQSSNPIKFNNDETINFTKNTKILTRTKVGDVWGKLCQFDVYVRPPKPVASIRSGDYSGEQLVELTCATDESRIYYTIDGTDPTDSSDLYDNDDSIPISTDTVLKAVAYSGEMSPSEIMTETYNFKLGLSLELMDNNQGSWLAKQKLATDGSTIFIAPYQVASCDIVAGISDAARLQVNGENINKGENGEFVFELQAKQVGSIVDQTELVKAKNTISVIANGERKDYTVYCVRANCDGLPDKVVDYFCVGSQYTNMIGGFGGNVEGTLVGSAGEFASTSLGNFGGYATWYYKDGIDNAPNNPYGVDFVVIGNSFDGTTEAAEPGNVLVSEDGNKWYTLAGAVHYDSCATWNQKVTYKKSNNPAGKTDYLLDGSEMVTLSNYVYPLKRAYPLHESIEDFREFTTFGTFINARDEKNEFDNTLPVYPAFGYVDTGYCNSYSNEAENPYRGLFRGSMVGHSYPERILTNRNGDGFDLDWAVDENGEPVALNSIHYVKVQSATGIINDSIGEKSTEVCCMRIAKPADSSVGVTAAPASIKIDGTAVQLKPGEVVDAAVDGVFDIAVDTPEDANVYINSLRSHTAFMDKAPHDIVRVIVQEGEKEPLIYYYNIKQEADSNTVYEITLDSGKGLLQDKEKLTCYVDSDTIEHFGGKMSLPDAQAAKKVQKFAYWYADLGEEGEKRYDAVTAENAEELAGKTLKAFYAKAEDVDAVRMVEALIDDLPEAAAVKTTDEEEVIAAGAAFDGLADTQKALVDQAKAEKLAAVRLALFDAFAAAIPDEVTEEQEDALAAAQTVYDSLPNDLKVQAAANYIKLVEAKLSVAMEKLEKANQQIADKQSEIDKLTGETIPALTQQLNDKIAELKTAKEEEIPALQAEIAELEQKLEKAGSDLADANAEIEELRKELVDNSIKDLIESAEKTIAAIQKDLKEAGDSISTKAIKALVETADQILDTAKTKAEEASAALEANAKEIASLRDQVAKASADLAKAGEELAKAVASGKASEAEITGLKDRLAEAEAAKTEAEKAAQEALAGKQTSDEALEAAQKALKETQDELEKTAAELAALQAEIAASKFKVTGLTVTSKARKFTVTWTKYNGADGYKVQYRKKGAKKFKNLKVLTKNKVVSKKLKKGNSYQFRVRTYKMVGEKKVYGKWAKSKAVKCK